MTHREFVEAIQYCPIKPFYVMDGSIEDLSAMLVPGKIVRVHPHMYLGCKTNTRKP